MRSTVVMKGMQSERGEICCSDDGGEVCCDDGRHEL